VGSRHDFSVNGASTAFRASTETQVCKFCHAPHAATSQKLIWSKAASTVTGWAAASTTQSGTILPTAIQPGSRLCLSCHDGVLSVGAMGTNPPIAGAGLRGTKATDESYGVGEFDIGTQWDANAFQMLDDGVTLTSSSGRIHVRYAVSNLSSSDTIDSDWVDPEGDEQSGSSPTTVGQWTTSTHWHSSLEMDDWQVGTWAFIVKVNGVPAGWTTFEIE